MTELEESWKDHEPSPIEYFHATLQKEFHKFRLCRTENTTFELNGIEFNSIVVSAKKATYEKYKKLDLHKPVLKSFL